MANRFPLIFNSGAGQIQELAASDNLDLTSSNLVNAGILFTSSGSDTAPSLQIGSGTTYKPGLYSPGTDQLAISTNGVERVRLSSTGEFMFKGAGTTPGTDKAVSFNGSAPVNSMVLDSSGRLGIGTSSVSELLQVSKTGGANIQVDSGSSNVVAKFGASGAGAFVGSTSNDYFQIYSNNTARIHVTAAGLVGIGTTSPAYSLDVSTSAAITNNGPQKHLYFRQNTLAQPNAAAIGATDDGNFSHHLQFFTKIPGTNNSALTERARFDSSGRLLVGTTTNNPTFESRVQVAGSGGGATILIDAYSANSNAPVLYFGKSRNATVGIQTIVQNNDSLGVIDFYGADNSGPVNAATITCRVDATATINAVDFVNDRRYKIATVSDTNFMAIGASANTVGVIFTATDVHLGSGTGTATSEPYANSMPGRLVFSTTSDSASSPTERMRITSTGNISIGTLGDPGYKLGIIATTTTTPSLSLRSNAAGDAGTAQLRLSKADADSTTSQIFIQFVIDGNNVNSGQINANGASQAAFGSFSDRRLKENIENLPSQINNIKALRPVEFDYKDKSGHQIGFVAQEMEQIYPDAIGVGENEMLTITGWSKTEARLVKALQEAITKIETLEARLTAAGID